MKFQVVTDSSSDLLGDSYNYSDIGFDVVPLTLRIGDYEYVDDVTIDVHDMLSELAETKGEVGSSCPSPEAWAETFRRADNTFAVCITSKLSGTYNSALQAKEIVLSESPEKNIHVIDTKAVAGVMVVTAERLFKLIKENLTFDEIKAQIDSFVSERSLLFSLEKFDMLIKTGRMNKLIGLTATALGVRAIATAKDGAIEVITKVRGEHKTLEKIAQLMGEFKPNFNLEKDAEVIISHCNNLISAQRLRGMIIDKYDKLFTVRLVDTRGLCSFYAADGGLLISF